MKKIMISVAPVAADATYNDPDEIARDVYACYKEGASMVHLHCRDRQGRLTAELSRLEETVTKIRALCPIVIEISTGGISDLTIRERCQTCYPDWVECNSLNVGSVNLGEAVYCNPIGDVRFCVEQILTHHKIPEIEIFEIGMLNTSRELAAQYAFERPILFALVLGHQGAMPATDAALNAMIDGLYENFPDRDGVLWGVAQAHRTDWELMKRALDKGANAVRIGFEDSDFLSPAQRAESNAPLVSAMASIIRGRGMAPCTPDEARSMLHIPAR